MDISESQLVQYDGGRVIHEKRASYGSQDIGAIL